MLKQSSVKHTQQDARIKKLESELSEVKQELETIKIAKEDQVRLIATYLKEADEKQERRDKEIHKNDTKKPWGNALSNQIYEH